MVSVECIIIPLMLNVAFPMCANLMTFGFTRLTFIFYVKWCKIVWNFFLSLHILLEGCVNVLKDI
jgi:hypothetical protein